jgi:hypothetical protein
VTQKNGPVLGVLLTLVCAERRRCQRQRYIKRALLRTSILQRFPQQLEVTHRVRGARLRGRAPTGLNFPG